MKHVFFSDIHANLEALNIMLQTCEMNGIKSFICLGDIVGYNANPKECLDIIRNLPGIVCCKGNHDEYISNGDDVMEGFNANAKAAVLWSRSRLNSDDIDFLASLPLRKNIKQLNTTIVHSTLDNPEAWGYVFDVHQATDNFAYQGLPLCFCGHSHSPVAFMKIPVSKLQEGMQAVQEIPEWADKREYTDEEILQTSMISIQLQPGYKYLVNIGSVGQPRNRDPRASFVIYDDETKVITRMRIPYNITATQTKILEAGLPERLALRLAHGV